MGVALIVLVFVVPWLLLGLDLVIRYARDPEKLRAEIRVAQRANEAVSRGGSEWSQYIGGGESW